MVDTPYEYANYTTQRESHKRYVEFIKKYSEDYMGNRIFSVSDLFIMIDEIVNNEAMIEQLSNN